MVDSPRGVGTWAEEARCTWGTAQTLTLHRAGRGWKQEVGFGGSHLSLCPEAAFFPELIPKALRFTML